MVVHDYMRQIVDTHIGRPLPDPLAISAKALFHGAKPFQDRERWPLSKRLDLLHAILNIPITFQLSVIVGFCRNVPEEDTGLEPRKAIANRHARAFVVCTLAAERFMRAETASRRVATMIVENNTDTKQAIKETQRMMRTPLALQRLQPHFHRFLPLRKIVEDPHFVEKDASAFLPIADACAFTFARWLSGREYAEGLMTAMMGPAARPHDWTGNRAGHQYYRFGAGLKTGILSSGTRFGDWAW